MDVLACYSIAMNKSAELDYIKEKSLPELKRAGVLKSAIFGSFARGDANKESDIDFLVELPKGASLVDFIRLKQSLEFSLGKRVDLVTYRSISKFLKDKIMRDQMPLL